MIDEKFIFTGAAKSKLVALMVTGVVLLLIGIFFITRPSYGVHGGHGEEHKAEITHSEGHAAGHGEAASHEVSHDQHAGAHATADAAHGEGHAEGHHTAVWVLRLMKNLWHNNVFFTGIAIIGIFFVAFNYVAWAGWSVVIKRVPEAFGYWVPFAGIIMVVAFLWGGHDLFHWAHDGVAVKGNPNYDEIIAGKAGYLNIPFFWIRLIAYFVLWYLVWSVIRKNSIKEDIEGGVKLYDSSIVWSAIFLVVFGISSSTSAWDWVMSIDTHFFSTMFGWYVLASWFVTGLAVITLFVVFLKDAGYLQMVNASHLHDLGKFVFAFSIFWTYIWFAQFLLIYYANIPEESVYFIERLQSGVYKPIFFMNIFINFVFPFLILMTREAKRQSLIIKVVCFMIIIGHWFDFYIMMTPGTLKDAGGLDYTTLFVELGMALIFAGAFIFTVLWGLTKANLVPKKHPMLEESLHHHVY